MSNMSNAEKLKRLLYVTENLGVYYAGNPEQHFLKNCKNNLEVVENLVKTHEDTKELINILVEVDTDHLLPRRVTLFYVLAYALSKTDLHENVETRQALAETALKICKNDDEFFKFISVFTILNKPNTSNRITTAMANVVRKYFEKKSVLEFAESVSKFKGYHGWKYKDLIKLSHYKGSSVEKTLIASYVLFGLEKLKNQESTQMKEVCEIVEKWEKLKKTEDELVAVELIKELRADFSHVNPKFIKSHEVWSAIIPHLSTREVLRLLPKFYKLGMLKSHSTVHGKVIESLTSLENIKSCKLHPIEVFISTKNFEKGGKPLDPQLESYLKSKKENFGEAKEKIDKIRFEPKCTAISAALTKCLSLSYPKDPYTLGLGKKIVLALDVTDHSSADAFCFKNKNINCLEAELALTQFYCKTEKNVNVTIYNNKEVKGINLDKNAPFAQNLKKLQESKSEFMTLTSVFDWASSKKKVVDLFICFIQTSNSLHAAPKDVKLPGSNALKESFLKYQKKMSANAKLVLICPGSHSIIGNNEINCLTICGFCPEIPKLIQAFANDTFQCV